MFDKRVDSEKLRGLQEGHDGGGEKQDVESTEPSIGEIAWPPSLNGECMWT